MKTFEEMTFDELVEWAAGHILKELIKGNFHSGVWCVCDASTRWHMAQEDNRKKKK